MKPICILILFAAFIIACGKREEVKAVIFERKELPQNRLLIRYHYSFKNVTYIDSTKVANHILPTDSVKVIIDPERPQKGLPDFSVVQ